MPKSKTLIMAQIQEMERKLEETVTAVDRGPVKDALKIVVPMMQDQISILKDLLELATV